MELKDNRRCRICANTNVRNPTNGIESFTQPMQKVSILAGGIQQMELKVRLGRDVLEQVGVQESNKWN